ncbi:hypothetical protein Phage2-1_00112 [Achromobacter phage 2-1]|nr:hypothetical protein Phage2-1_00112 [Achromobacter phage 2-1]
MPDRYWTSGCGRLELNIPQDIVDSVARTGDNTPAARQAVMQPEIVAQMVEIDMLLLRNLLVEYGIDAVDAMDDTTARMYLLWMACWDIQDGALN